MSVLLLAPKSRGEFNNYLLRKPCTVGVTSKTGSTVQRLDSPRLVSALVQLVLGECTMTLLEGVPQRGRPTCLFRNETEIVVLDAANAFLQGGRER
eukprot:6660134-Pyramimonas_sp.AAC.1